MSTYGADNLASLPELDENILLQELKVRYQQNSIYVSYFCLLTFAAICNLLSAFIIIVIIIFIIICFAHKKRTQ